MTETPDSFPPASSPLNPSLDAKDRLPQVEPPSGSFIVQLFLIPMLIVGVVVMIWLMFSWLAQKDNRPEELVAELERLNHASWQHALTLANNLNDAQHAEIRRDPLVASRLANVLQEHIDAQQYDENNINLRLYLCHALGNFEVSEVLPALMSAATSERDQAEIPVRRSALWAIGQVAEDVGRENVLADAKVMEAVQAASKEFSENSDLDDVRDRGRLRSTAAVVLGRLGGDAAEQRLTELLDDPYPDTRYNAAVALAGLGSIAANGMFVEMLDPANEEVLKYENNKNAGDDTWKRHDVMLQSLFAIKKLAAENKEADLSELADAIRALEKANVPNKLAVEATALALELDERAK